MTPIPALIVLLIVVLGVAAFGLKYIFDYRLTERGLYVVILRLVPVKILPLSRIAGVERGPFDRSFWSTGMFTNVRLGNRLRGEMVLVKAKNLPVTGVVVTPGDPDAFERDLRRLLEARARSLPR